MESHQIYHRNQDKKTATQLLLNRLDHPEMLSTRKLMPFNIVMCGD